jgi:protocatechuate 3,4-dioxygenase beta subunit
MKNKTNAPLDFALELATLPVTVGSGIYTLTELNGKQRDTYLQNLGLRLGSTKGSDKQTVKNFDGLQASLLTLCLTDTEGKPVTKALVQEWPAKVVSALFDAARELSGLGDDEEEEEGND